jgi:rfaE bifunctional protein nucleotidyltransferase chain/domain
MVRSNRQFDSVLEHQVSIDDACAVIYNVIMIKVFVNGTFDILHPGHVMLLQYAASLGQVTVAIDTDRRVRQLKGAGRPFFNQDERRLMLQGLKYVNKVCTFDTDQELEHIIQTSEPDIMVKGSDYRGRPIIGEEHVPHIEFFERLNEYSSTKAIQHIVTR